MEGGREGEGLREEGEGREGRMEREGKREEEAGG